jgi:hypothetical protein
MKWMADLSNWDTENFSQAFKTENHEKYDEKGQEVKKHRMMPLKSEDPNYADLSSNWCATTRKRLLEKNSGKKIKEKIYK